MFSWARGDTPQPEAILGTCVHLAGYPEAVLTLRVPVTSQRWAGRKVWGPAWRLKPANKQGWPTMASPGSV